MLEPGEFTVDASAFNSAEEGDYRIVVAQKGTALSVSYTASVRAVAPERMELQGQRLRFHMGDEFECGALSVLLHFADGTSVVLAQEAYTVDSLRFDGSVSGEYAITVSAPLYGMSETYTVYVLAETLPDYGNEISVLAIGNSFSQDAMRYLYEIFRGYGYEEIELANLMKSGASLADHCAAFRGDLPAYEFEHNTTGTWQSELGRSMEYGLTYRAWDIVVIQQVSGYAGDPASYGEDFEALAEYVASSVAESGTRIYWQMTWAYQGDSNHGDFGKYDRDQMTMYEAIVDTVRTQVQPYPQIDGIIPTGTAVQNLRTGSMGDTITRDGFHLNLNFGRYLAGLTWACALTGEDPMQGVAAGGVNAAQLKEIRESVQGALISPYEVTSIASRV